MKSPPPVNLDKYLDRNKHRYMSYEDAARMLGIGEYQAYSEITLHKRGFARKNTIDERGFALKSYLHKWGFAL